MKPDDPRHGTYAGAQRHYRDREQPCDPCLKGAAEYQRKRRKGSVSDSKRNSARTKALWRLAGEHPEDYRRLYIEEYRRLANVPRLDARVEGRPIERRKAS